MENPRRLISVLSSLRSAESNAEVLLFSDEAMRVLASGAKFSSALNPIVRRVKTEVSMRMPTGDVRVFIRKYVDDDGRTKIALQVVLVPDYVATKTISADDAAQLANRILADSNLGYLVNDTTVNDVQHRRSFPGVPAY